jgi:hypothetical protein
MGPTAANVHPLLEQLIAMSAIRSSVPFATTARNDPTGTAEKTMRREHLEHLLRAAGTIISDDDLIVIGSQSVLASFDEARLPPEAMYSMEADLLPMHGAIAEKADLIDGAIGEFVRALFGARLVDPAVTLLRVEHTDLTLVQRQVIVAFVESFMPRA